jgi:hypothetical protein
MPNQDEERLVVLLEARIRDLEKNMAKASGVTAKTYREMSLGSKRATKNMEQDMVRSTTRINQALAQTSTKIGAFGKAAIGGFIGGLVAGGIAGVVNQVRDVANAVAEVGDQAKMAGVDVKSFQELKFVAEQNRIGVDALTDGLKELNLRADEFILTGKGSSAEAFQRLGYGAEELKKKLEDPSALFTEIIGKLGKFEKAAQIRISDELFGGSAGEKFVQLIDQGEAGIRDTIKAANDLGIVMDDQLIERAAEIDRRFNAIANTVGTALKSAIVSAADSLMEFIDGFRDFQNQMSSTLQNKQADFGMRRIDLENERLALRGGDGLSSTASDLGFGDSRAPINAERLAEIDEQLEDLARQEAEIVDVLSKRVGRMNRTGNDTWTPPPATAAGSGSKGSRSSSASATERERQAIKDLIKELEEELALSGKTDAEKRAASASRQAGAAATEEERQKIISLNEALYQTEDANRRAQGAADFFANSAYDAFSDLIPKINTGNAALDRFVNTLIEAVAQAALLGSGPLAGLGGNSGGGGLFGALFGGLKLFSFDGGGSTGNGPRVGGVDGKGGFPAIVHPRETIVDHTRSRSSQGGHVTADVRVSVDNNGNLQAYVERVSKTEAGKSSAEVIRRVPGMIDQRTSDKQSRRTRADR